MKTLLVLALLLFAADDREALKKELARDPANADGHYRLAQTFDREGFRVPALLEYLRLLAIENDTPRATEAARRVVALLNHNVAKSKNGEITFTLDDKASKAEGDFQPYDLFLGLAAAAQESEGGSEFERTRAQLASVLGLIVESPPKSDNYTTRVNVPFFAKLELETFAGKVLLPLDLEGEEEWRKAQ
jgi:hypothetical protein